MDNENIIQKTINNKIHYYDQTYGILLEKIIPKLKTWVIIFGIVHLLFVNIFTIYSKEISNDGIIFVLPPFINIAITLFPFEIFYIYYFKTKRNNDINYIIEYYPDIAKKLYLPNGKNGFAWIKFRNYGYIKPREDEFIDKIIYNCDEIVDMVKFVFFGNVIILFMGFCCLIYWASIMNY